MKNRMKPTKHLFAVNANPNILVDVYRKSPTTITVWLKTGAGKNTQPLIQNAIVYETGSKIGAKNFMKRFVEIISLPKTRKKYLVLKGVSAEQIRQLLDYTRKYRLSKKFDHDAERFKTPRSFKTWQKRGKKVYTLTNKTGKLLGMAWFTEKKYEKHSLAFEARTYPPISDKSAVYKFSKVCYEDFRKDNDI
jgi:hypothetical protein